MTPFHKRQWFQERSFGEAAVEHGFKRARWRGLWRQQIQDLLIAAIQNLKIYLRHLSVRHFFTWLLRVKLSGLLGALRRLLAVDSRSSHHSTQPNDRLSFSNLFGQQPVKS